MELTSSIRRSFITGVSYANLLNSSISRFFNPSLLYLVSCTRGVASIGCAKNYIKCAIFLYSSTLKRWFSSSVKSPSILSTLLSTRWWILTMYAPIYSSHSSYLITRPFWEPAERETPELYRLLSRLFVDLFVPLRWPRLLSRDLITSGDGDLLPDRDLDLYFFVVSWGFY